MPRRKFHQRFRGIADFDNRSDVRGNAAVIHHAGNGAAIERFGPQALRRLPNNKGIEALVFVPKP